MTWTLVIHGGAGKLDSEMVSPEQDAGARAGLSRALDVGSKVLADGGSALDAVEAAVRTLEDDPHFNSGRGAVFTHYGTLELDAAIMDGRTRAAGAVAAATATRNPVGLARAILDDGRHVFLAGKGADAFSLERDLPQADAAWFATDERRRQFAEFQADGGGFDVDMKYGTVGAVACDTHGHVAAATSTGGVTGKRWGRIGDTPVIGAGTFADDRACAVSCTGSGEFFLRVGVGHEIAARVRLSGESLQVAADRVLAEVKALGGTGGVIVAGPDGDIAWGFNTVGMYRGRASSEGSRTVAIYANEPA
ncbi:isoaspartyl peptidase/L-asparaginase family protein [Sphingomonas sp. Leaf242]|uniref:isoaspartyl peptidase/L-asparaginase family protein n=1 Tax=Sphingomonas sp. Leaf242 TaxID=1736304 RepID=UPI00071452FC|nr:isoaspartyl peptidase/L-asparaginase [Sphingomonas sp. Leaf242]KQO07984.1 asparaginase [Sphingomonas sp. Leaf242]